MHFSLIALVNTIPIREIGGEELEHILLGLSNLF